VLLQENWVQAQLLLQKGWQLGRGEIRTRRRVELIYQRAQPVPWAWARREMAFAALASFEPHLEPVVGPGKPAHVPDGLKGAVNQARRIPRFLDGGL